MPGLGSLVLAGACGLFSMMFVLDESPGMAVLMAIIAGLFVARSYMEVVR